MEAEKAPEVTVPAAPVVAVAPTAAPVELAPEAVKPEPALELTPAPVAVAEKAAEAVMPSTPAEAAPVAPVVAEKEPETAALPAPAEVIASPEVPLVEKEPDTLPAAVPVAEPPSEPSASEENAQAAAPVAGAAEKVVGFPELEDEFEAAPKAEKLEQAAPVEVVSKLDAPGLLRKSLEEDFLAEPSAPEVSPLSQAAAEATQSEVEVPAAKEELAAPAPALAAPVPSRRPPSFIELPSEEPAEKMELAEPWEFSGGWQQNGQLDTETGHAARPTNEDRGIELDTSEAGASNSPQDEVMLASAFDFMPKWQRLEEEHPAEESAPAESTVPQASAMVGQGSGVSSSANETVPLEEALAALRSATTKGALGKALLSYCQGRYARAFLLGENFGFARVGLAYGPGSDRADVTTLQVDLEAPSLLLAAATGGKPVVSSIPESPEDEALFLALGEQFSHLMAAPIRLHERTVAYVVIDGGPGTFDPAEVEELEQVVTVASAEYSRLHESAS